MSLNQIEPKAFTDDDNDNSTTIFTPPQTIIADFLEAPARSAVPWAGSTFIIRCMSTHKVLTLVGGRIMLAPRGGGAGTIRWECVENHGWLGFRDPATHLFLGHSDHDMCCRAPHHDEWERFIAQATPDGGYVLSMPHWWKLCPVGLRGDQLVKYADGSLYSGVVWQFEKVGA
ncbi:hypothetical protein BDV95DRAFT_580934 [Massariosphaeria phaeospora]|uniref:Uncharacterized protein n=1 Tax=Massariosphaeria phaeospora TaxID=100035 RepID=A0A7C8M458_9PLEO|nr:hypothetical protein BDV95DRAFT_580934 [Massariosphaeria phaeospora]